MGYNIPLDKAELLATILETLLYGISLPMFGATICSLLPQRSTQQVNRKMIIVAFALLLFSTVHFVIDIIRIMEGFILFADIFPGGAIGYFADVSQWTFVSKNYVYTAQTLVGDGVILYRCYVVWQSKLIMILPLLLWCAVVVTGIGSPYTASQVSQVEVFGGSLSQWITSFFASTLATNLLTTILLASRIWYVYIKATGIRSNRSQLRAILQIIVDAGVIYSVTLIAALICFAKESNGQYVMLDMVTPIISITFYMVIIRVGLANRANQSNVLPLGYTSSSTGNSSGDRRSRMQVRITSLVESKVEDTQRQSIPMTSVGSENNRLSISKFEEAEEVV